MVTICDRRYISDCSKRPQGGTFLKPDHFEVTSACSAVHHILARVGDKWTVLVVSYLGNRSMRFNELKTGDQWYLAKDADEHITQPRARRFRHANGLSDYSAACRLRTDGPRDAICWCPCEGLATGRSGTSNVSARPGPVSTQPTGMPRYSRDLLTRQNRESCQAYCKVR